MKQCGVCQHHAVFQISEHIKDNLARVQQFVLRLRVVDNPVILQTAWRCCQSFKHFLEPSQIAEHNMSVSCTLLFELEIVYLQTLINAHFKCSLDKLVSRSVLVLPLSHNDRSCYLLKASLYVLHKLVSKHYELRHKLLYCLQLLEVSFQMRQYKTVAVLGEALVSQVCDVLFAPKHDLRLDCFVHHLRCNYVSETLSQHARLTDLLVALKFLTDQHKLLLGLVIVMLDVFDFVIS